MNSDGQTSKNLTNELLLMLQELKMATAWVYFPPCSTIFNTLLWAKACETAKTSPQTRLPPPLQLYLSSPSSAWITAAKLRLV